MLENKDKSYTLTKREIIQHIVLESILKSRQSINESSDYLLERKLLLEKYGIPDGLVELAEEIAYEVQSKGIAKIEPGKNPLFGPIGWIEVTFNNKMVSTSRDIKIGDGSIHKYEISIRPNLKDDYLIIEIAHELLHIFQSIKKREKGLSQDDEMKKTGYNKLGPLMTSQDEIEKAVSWIYYLDTNMEKDAYTAYLSALAKKIIERKNEYGVKDINDVWPIIRQTVVYGNYETVLHNAGIISMYKNISDQQKVSNIIKKITGKNISDYSKFASWLKHKTEKVKQHITNSVSKCISDTWNQQNKNEDENEQ